MVAAAESALLLCGAAFALSSTLVWEQGWRFAAPALLLSIPPVLYVTVVTLWNASRVALLVGLGVVVQLGLAGWCPAVWEGATASSGLEGGGGAAVGRCDSAAGGIWRGWRFCCCSGKRRTAFIRFCRRFSC